VNGRNEDDDLPPAREHPPLGRDGLDEPQEADGRRAHGSVPSSRRDVDEIGATSAESSAAAGTPS
jgi:hypothetical protein